MRWPSKRLVKYYVNITIQDFLASSDASEPARARLLWAILFLVLPVTFRRTTACRSLALAFSAAIHFAMKCSFFFHFFFVELFSPEREQNMAFFRATVFFAAVGPCRVMTLEKKKKSIKKRQRFRKNHRRGASDTGKGSYKHNVPDLWDRGSITRDKLPAPIQTILAYTLLCSGTTKHA